MVQAIGRWPACQAEALSGGALRELAVTKRKTKLERRRNERRQFHFVRLGGSLSLFLMVAVTQVVTALVMSLPITWLVNHVFAATAIQPMFASDRFGYWQCMGMYAIWLSAKARIKVMARINWTMKSFRK
jgi:hypothetical protein